MRKKLCKGRKRQIIKENAIREKIRERKGKIQKLNKKERQAQKRKLRREIKMRKKIMRGKKTADDKKMG